VLYRNLGDPVTAIGAFDEAAEIFRELGDEAALSNALLNTALARHRNLGQPEAAEDLYRRALDLARRSGDRSEEVQDLFYLGELLLDRKRLPEAERMFTRGLEVAEASGSAEGLWSALRGLGETALAAGRPREALDPLLRAIDEIERVRASLRHPGRRAGYFGDKRPVYGSAVAALAELARREPDGDHAERALEIVQRAKARELLEAMGTHPRMAPLTAAELEARTGDARVMELFLAHGHLFSWVFESDRLVMRDLGPSAPLVRWVTEIHRRLAAGHEPPSAELRELSRVLVHDSGVLDGVPEAGPLHLRIAPDGRLFYLPFEILQDPATGRALVERAELSYLPCASLLPALDGGTRHQETRPSEGFLGFGDPRLPEPQTTGVTSAALLTSRFRLQPLPGAERELATVARWLPGNPRIYTREAATEEVFRREAVRGARVLHLSTHTLVDERLNGRAGSGAAVVLTPAGDDDGMLTPAEIAALEVRTDLTVLASCRSALGAVSDGQALASLTGSVLAAGSSAVVATLWDVEDEASAVFMEQLYHGLGRGLTPAAALRSAKRRLRADPRWGRPHLWAGYVLMGESPPVVEPSFLRSWRWALMVGFATTLLLAVWTWSRRRRAPAESPPQPGQGTDWF
jgi:CHAT domain-containing protein